MTDRQELLLVLVVIYLAECFRWVRRGGMVFRRWIGPRWHRQTSSELIGNDRGDLHWTWPLPDFGDFVVARGFAWSAGPEGIATWHPASAHPSGRPLQPVEFRRWEDARDIQLEGEKVFVANRCWWVADSQVEAQRLASLLKRWAELSRDQRAEGIRADLQDSFSVAAVRKKLEVTTADLVSLRRLGMAIWGILFLLLPISVWRYGWLPALPAGLLSAYALSGWTAWRTVRLHSQWYPRAVTERFRLRLLCGFSPLTAIRAADLVGRNRVEAFDPLAVALALLPKHQAGVVGAAWSRDAWFPRLPENPFPPDTEAASTVRWFSAAYREAGGAALKSAGWDPAAALRPPPASEAANSRYCARCEDQFLPIATACQACGGRPLVRLRPTDSGTAG